MNREDVKLGQKIESYAIDISRGLIGYVTAVGSNLHDSHEVEFPGWKYGHDGNLEDKQIVNRWFLASKSMELREDVKIPLCGNLLPADAAERKRIPVGTGVLDYFPAALAEIAKVSQAGNDQHNRGQDLHWARGKSTDQYDTMIRHSLERGTRDTDGQRHSAKMAWRALAILQLELEAEGAPVARGAK